jgi:hypothetical protein
MMFAMYESSQKIVGYDSRSRGSVECDSTQKTIGCAGGGGRSAGSERVSGWEAIGGVFQLTRHWSGLLGGDRGEARVGLPPLNCAVGLLHITVGA